MTKSSFRFIHAADLHIDSALQGLQRYEEAPVEKIRHASRDAFQNLIAFAKERDVDFVILAGDIFDGDWQDFRTGLWFSARLRELTASGIRVYLLAGNHDAEAKMTKSLELPEGVFRFDTRQPQTFVDEPTAVQLHGQGFAKAATFDNLALTYPAAVPSAFNIGVLHTNLANNKGHAPYAPASPDDLKARGYDYWALGHVHQREVVSESPYIVFPGNLQGRHARETGAKGATVVEVEGGRISSVKHESFDVLRFQTLELDIRACCSVPDCERALLEAMTMAKDAAEGRLLALRVVVTGRSKANRALRAEFESFLAASRNQANALEDVWLEKIVLESKPEVSTDGSEIVNSLELDDEDLATATIQAFRADLDALLAKLPGDLGRLSDDSAQEVETMRDESFLRSLYEEAKAELVVRLTEADADKSSGAQA